jgi:hypothetical protein
MNKIIFMWIYIRVQEIAEYTKNKNLSSFFYYIRP